MKNKVLIDWLETNKVSMSKLAKSCNISRQMVFNYFKADMYMPIELIPKISAYTGIKAKDLRPDIYKIFEADLH